jgi:hypothetical protein
MNTLLLLGFLVGSSPDADAAAALALAKAARERAPAVVAKAELVRTGYPVHPTRWTYPGEIHAHLKSGQHAGKWPSWWIDTLTRQQAESLHDSDHEGRVDWSYVPGRSSPAVTATPALSKPYTPRTLYAPAYCPTGASH